MYQAPEILQLGNARELVLGDDESIWLEVDLCTSNSTPCVLCYTEGGYGWIDIVFDCIVVDWVS